MVDRRATAFLSGNIFELHVVFFVCLRQDVVFKLNYFEQQQRFMTIGQIIEEMTRHYTKQAIKQM